MMCPVRSPRLPLLVGSLLAGFLAACAGGSREGATPSPAAATDSVETALQHAESAFKDGDYVEAQKAYEEALRIAPDHPRAVVGLSTCCLKNHQVKRAHDLLADHLTRHPENTAARLVLARTLVRQAEFPAAAEQLRVVLEQYAPEGPGLFLYFPSRAQVSPALKAFVEVAREVTGDLDRKR